MNAGEPHDLMDHVYLSYTPTNIIANSVYCSFLNLTSWHVLNAGHHPDLHLVGWNNVKIDIWTHSVGMDGFS